MLEKYFIFSMLDLKPFSIILYIPNKKLFFQCGIWNHFIYILYVHKKKVMFFQCGIWNTLVYVLYIHKKKVIFFQCGIKIFLV